MQVNGGKLPQHVVPFCVGAALLAAAIPLVSELLQRIVAKFAVENSGLGKSRGAAPRPSRLSRASGQGDEDLSASARKEPWQLRATKLAIWLLPSGIGFAVGMYIQPKWTIPRVLGSALEQGWLRYNPASHRSLMVIIASGLVLGEGIASIANAGLAAACKQHSCASLFG